MFDEYTKKSYLKKIETNVENYLQHRSAAVTYILNKDKEIEAAIKEGKDPSALIHKKQKMEQTLRDFLNRTQRNVDIVAKAVPSLAPRLKNNK
ncbi:MAG TPA: hypothetical protein VGV92_06180 [Gammaproteobacteria bacterium]|nr:hypothetical protein [Gammaproteobacteria bacterium]